MATTKKTGKFQGKSNTLGQGGRTAQLKSQGVPGGVIGDIARAKGAAPGQKNFHRTKKRTAPDANNQTSSGPNESGNSLRKQSTKKRGAASLISSVAKNFTTNVGNATAKASGWPRGVNDVALNKSGTIGTEPISKGGNKFTEVKAGPLAVDVPMGKLRKRSMPQRKTHRSMNGMEMLKKATK